MEKQMQEKLEQYRLRKRRKERFDDFKEKVSRFFMLGTGIGTGNTKEDTTIDISNVPPPVQEKSATNNNKLLPAKLSDIDEDEADLVYSSSSDEEPAEKQRTIPTELQQQNRWYKYTIWTVYMAFWTTLYIIAIELKFGIVFLMFSALFFIYFNTRTGVKKKNEISAYSVFNKNCESIDGTLKAEQFEREIRYGPLR